MDINTPKKNDSLELARELLIAISNSVPDKPLNSKSAYKNSKTWNGIAVNKKKGTTDKLRSKLISISSVPSPDKTALPEVGAQEV